MKVILKVVVEHEEEEKNVSEFIRIAKSKGYKVTRKDNVVKAVKTIKGGTNEQGYSNW